MTFYFKTRSISPTAGGGGDVVWGSIDGNLSDQTDLTEALGGKQATLVSGTNIKTINNQSLLGSGNLSVGVTATYNAEERMLTLA